MKNITGSDLFRYRDYPVGINDDGTLNEESLKKANKQKSADIKSAIEFDKRALKRWRLFWYW